MLKAVLIYRSGRSNEEVPIIESEEPAILRLVAKASLENYRRALETVDDPVFEVLLQGEVSKAKTVLEKLGVIGDHEP